MDEKITPAPIRTSRPFSISYHPIGYERKLTGGGTVRIPRQTGHQLKRKRQKIRSRRTLELPHAKCDGAPAATG